MDDTVKLVLGRKPNNQFTKYKTDEEREAALSKVPRTEGQRLFLASGVTIDQAAKLLGVNRSLVGAWRQGTKLPGSQYRMSMQKHWNIPAKAWSVIPGAAIPTKPEPKPKVKARPAKPSEPIVYVATARMSSGNTTIDDVTELINQMRGQLRNIAEMMPADRSKLMDSFSKALNLKSRLEREQEIAEDRYVREHPAWVKTRAAIIAALEPYPDASDAVAQALQKLGMADDEQ